MEHQLPGGEGGILDMAKTVYFDTKLLVDGYDLSGDINRATVEHKAEIHDATGFGSSQFREKIPGLKTLNLSFEGYYDIGDGEPDPLLFNTIGSTASEIIVIPEEGSAGETALFCKGVQASFSPGGDVGGVARLNINSEGATDLVRGTCMGASTYTETANGTAYNLGAVTAAQSVYICAMATAVSGTDPTIDIKLQSDDAEGFLDPTDQITLSQMTETGDHEWSSKAGAITDDWWRVVVTIGGTDPSATVYIVAGIL
jgi:hypothetical protein